MVEKDKFGEVLGIWKVNVGGADLELTPKLTDVRRMRSILFNDKMRKDKELMFVEFEKMMVDMIKRDYPTDPEEKVTEFVGLYVMQLFEEATVALRFTTREQHEQNKTMATQELKNLIGDG